MTRRVASFSAKEALDALDRNILCALAALPWQRIADLRLSLERSESTLSRHLSRLEGHQLVESVPAVLAGTSVRMYALGRRGAVLLAEQQPEEACTRMPGADETHLLSLLPRLSRLVLLQRVIDALVSEAPQTFALHGRAASVQWHWWREYATVIALHETAPGDSTEEGNDHERMRVSVDAALVLHVTRHQEAEATLANDGWYGAWLLLDDGVLPPRTMRRRLDGLLVLRATTAVPIFPAVVVLTMAAHRSRHWQRLAVELARQRHVSPLVGAVAAMDPSATPLPSPWRLAWHTLATNAPCRLREVFQGLSPKTLPPGLEPPYPPPPARDGLAHTIAAPPEQGRMVRGQVRQRARHLTQQPNAAALARHDALALTSVCLRPCHTTLLDLLYLHPFLSVNDAAAFLALAPTSVARYLGDLRRFALLEREWLDVDHQSAPEVRWRLSTRGLRLVAARHHLSLKSIASPTRRGLKTIIVQQGLVGLRAVPQQTAGVYGFFATLARSARRLGQGHHLLWWEHGSAREQYYFAHQAWRHHRPDGIAEYQAGTQRVRFWLEWVRPSQRGRDLEENIEAYRAAIASREWAREGAVLPIILMVLPDGGQEAIAWSLVRARLGTLRHLILVHTTTHGRLSSSGPLAPIWSQALPNTAASTRGEEAAPRRLFYDLRTPKSTR